jgi:hypothetical protein
MLFFAGKEDDIYNAGMNQMGRQFEVYVNPDPNEIEITKKNGSNSVRGVIDNSKLYVWPGGILHFQINNLCTLNPGKNINIDGFRFAYETNNGWLLESQNKYTSDEVLTMFEQNKNLLSQIGDITQSIEVVNSKDKLNNKYKMLGDKFIVIGMKRLKKNK